MQALDYRVAKEDRRAESAEVPVRRTHLSVGFALAGVLLSAASWVVVVQGARDEPYMGYRRYDAIVQVGVGTALIVLWGCCAAAVLVLVAARKLRRRWLALVVWAAVCTFYLSYSPLGYLKDLEKYVIPADAGGG